MLRAHMMGRSLLAAALSLLAALVLAALGFGMPRWDNTRLQFVAGNDAGLTGSGTAFLPTQTITASGQTAWFSGSDVSTINLLLVIAGAVTGTSPTFQLIVETDDGAGGNIQTLFTFATQTATLPGGLRKGGITGVDQRWRLRWVVTGTTPSFVGVKVTGETK